jgi:lipopolysaccharide transport system ATP-binding protein
MSSGRGTIVFDDVGKRFRRGRRHDTLRDLIPSLARGLVGRQPKVPDEFWALRNVSFEVRPGEALGVIGPNGAGKSTILKLLTRLLLPTYGRVAVTGRIGALIEIAAGFHTELTGRENIYLQGAIMGMRRAEIGRRFDEIVDFSGVAEFLDTPVKRYSSGMNARLGFAIAAHLDPDVLLVDEVLSVGDAAFQRKATARLHEIVRRDIAVVMVSHQLDRVVELCGGAIVLDHGEVVHRGPPEACVAAYLSSMTDRAVPDAGRSTSPVTIETLHAESVSAPASDGVAAIALCSGDALVLRLRGTVRGALGPATVGVRITGLPNEDLTFATNSAAHGIVLPSSGPFELRVELRVNVVRGLYRAQAVVWNRDDKSDWLLGPALLLSVDKDPAAFGRVYMSPSLRLLSP